MYAASVRGQGERASSLTYTGNVYDHGEDPIYCLTIRSMPAEPSSSQTRLPASFYTLPPSLLPDENEMSLHGTAAGAGLQSK